MIFSVFILLALGAWMLNQTIFKEIVNLQAKGCLEQYFTQTSVTEKQFWLD